MIRVIIVDDHEIIRDGIKLLIEQDPEIKVIASGRNGQEAITLCESHFPDILLMDIKMPVLDGIEATRIIKLKQPSIKIVILTTFKDISNVAGALSNGADSYILKDTQADRIVKAIKETVIGNKIYDAAAIETLSEHFANNEIQESGNERSVHFSERDLQIIRYIAEGKNNAYIAEKLFLARGTVGNIISELLERLDFDDRIQLAVYAVKNKIV